MHAKIYYEDRVLDAARARVPATSPHALYGRGVFTTLAVYHGRPFLWAEHWERLRDHAARLDLDFETISEERVRLALSELIAANAVESGRARITLLAATHKASNILWAREETARRQKAATQLLIFTADARPPPAPDGGLALTVSPYRANTLSPLAGIKSVNYMEHYLAWEEARAREFDEAVMLNERGELVGATMANVFWVRDGKLHTPALITGCLRGTTRGRVLALAAALAVPVVEGAYELSHLNEADEIFLTSSGLGLSVVTTFDIHRYSTHAGSTALRLHEAFRQLTLHNPMDDATEVRN